MIVRCRNIEEAVHELVFGDADIGDTVQVLNGTKVEVYNVVPAEGDDKKYQNGILKLERSIELVHK